ncbi:hypothetical protein ACJX0J_012215, partial [Zea mays]
ASWIAVANGVAGLMSSICSCSYYVPPCAMCHFDLSETFVDTVYRKIRVHGGSIYYGGRTVADM